jgi:DNA-binding IclR family transcriptional regulator
LIKLPVDAETQDRTFRNRGGEWLMSNTRNEPTDNAAVKKELARITRQRPGYQLQGTYGEHLKAIVEAFVEASRHLLLGPTYRIGAREVPRMAFRLEIVDEFRAMFRVEGVSVGIAPEVTAPRAKLAAILIERRKGERNAYHSAAVGTRLSTHFGLIHKFLPEIHLEALLEEEFSRQGGRATD